MSFLSNPIVTVVLIAAIVGGGIFVVWKAVKGGGYSGSQPNTGKPWTPPPPPPVKPKPKPPTKPNGDPI